MSAPFTTCHIAYVVVPDSYHYLSAHCSKTAWGMFWSEADNCPMYCQACLPGCLGVWTSLEGSSLYPTQRACPGSAWSRMAFPLHQAQGTLGHSASFFCHPPTPQMLCHWEEPTNLSKTHQQSGRSLWNRPKKDERWCLCKCTGMYGRFLSRRKFFQQIRHNI